MISFLVIEGFWIGHHIRFCVITRDDDGLIFLNLLLLMVIAFVPFPTAVFSKYANRMATIFYAQPWRWQRLLSALMWWYALRGNRSAPADLNREQGRQRRLRSLIVPAVFLLSIGIAFVNDDVAKYSWSLIALAGLLVR